MRYERDDLLIILAQILLVNMLSQTGSVKIIQKKTKQKKTTLSGPVAEEWRRWGVKKHVTTLKLPHFANCR